MFRETVQRLVIIIASGDNYFECATAKKDFNTDKKY